MEPTQNGSPYGKKILLASIVLLVALGMFGYAAFYATPITPQNPREVASTDAYFKSLLGSEPAPLQNALVADVRSGVNDAYTKSDAYFIMHRYFDTGNIYELYEYVNSHPELAFLKEAERIYPVAFGRIRDGIASSTYSWTGLYAYLGYVEVLEKNGYTDIASLSTLANQYAKLAYFRTILNELKYQKRDSGKAVLYAKKAGGTIVDILEGRITAADMPARDILVGLNQYGAALRYLQADGVDTSWSPKTADEVFKFGMDYSARYVRELNLFTSLLNASTLVIVKGSSADDIKTALYPILDFDTKKVALLDTSIIHNILNARLERSAPLADRDLDVYGKTNIVALATAVPEFKTWLTSNGWKDTDFK